MMKKPKMVSFVSTDQMGEMAEAAADAFEMNCDWGKCGETAREFAWEEWGIRVRSSVCYAAVNFAKVIWQSRVDKAKEANHDRTS